MPQSIVIVLGPYNWQIAPVPQFEADRIQKLQRFECIFNTKHNAFNTQHNDFISREVQNHKNRV